MSFLQGIPESSQLLVMGGGLLFVGILFRKVRKEISISRELARPTPPPHSTEFQRPQPVN